jgi:hypothetical protein
MEVVTKAAQQNKLLPGKVGFVLVGCVVYKAPFEPLSTPRHETRFIYYLAAILPQGGFLSDVQPFGVANTLRLVGPVDITAD